MLHKPLRPVTLQVLYIELLTTDYELSKCLELLTAAVIASLSLSCCCYTLMLFYSYTVIVLTILSSHC